MSTPTVESNDDRHTGPAGSGAKPIRVPGSAEGIDGLTRELARENNAIGVYGSYMEQLTGPYRAELRARFAAEVTQTQRHARFLASEIARLQGTPVSRPVSPRFGTSRGRCWRIQEP
jgi:bacterioferritin (cytochrome b1)